MPYVIVKGSLEPSYRHPPPPPPVNNHHQQQHLPGRSFPSSNSSGGKPVFSVAVSGLKANELSDLRNFSPGANKDNYTITFPQHPCVILNALEVLGFRVVASTASPAEPALITWTLRKEFDDQA